MMTKKKIRGFTPLEIGKKIINSFLKSLKYLVQPRLIVNDFLQKRQRRFLSQAAFTPLRDSTAKIASNLAKAGCKTLCFYKFKSNLKSLTGFTLVELMLVVIIIGILVAMVVPRLAGRSEQAKIAAAEADIKANIALALDLFELDCGSFPTTDQGLKALRQNPDSSKFKGWKGPYLKREPTDPWGNSYKYACPSTHGVDYDLYSFGPDGKDDGGGGDDVTSWEKSSTESE